jgi:hypothetical protein
MRWWNTPLRPDVASAPAFGWRRHRCQLRLSPRLSMSVQSLTRRTVGPSQWAQTLPHHLSNSHGECENSSSDYPTDINWS